MSGLPTKPGPQLCRLPCDQTPYLSGSSCPISSLSSPPFMFLHNCLNTNTHTLFISCSDLIMHTCLHNKPYLPHSVISLLLYIHKETLPCTYCTQLHSNRLWAHNNTTHFSQTLTHYQRQTTLSPCLCLSFTH